jgi:hypothetical protein
LTNLAFNFDPIPAEISLRISDARATNKLSPCESDVLDLLSESVCLGRDKALGIAAMQAVWERRGKRVWPDRSIKDSVKQLLEIFEVPIGSSRARGSSGYYFLSDSEDLEAAERPLRAEIISLVKRLKTINPKSRFAQHIAGQLQMEGEL